MCFSVADGNDCSAEDCPLLETITTGCASRKELYVAETDSWLMASAYSIPGVQQPMMSFIYICSRTSQTKSASHRSCHKPGAAKRPEPHAGLNPSGADPCASAGGGDRPCTPDILARHTNQRRGVPIAGPTVTPDCQPQSALGLRAGLRTAPTWSVPVWSRRGNR